MKNIFLKAATSSVIAGALLMSGTAFAEGLHVAPGLHLGVDARANLQGDDNNHGTLNATVGENDNDSDHGGDAKPAKHATSTKPILVQGNGQPIIGGTVTAVSGSTITVTTTSGSIVYTVNASGAVIAKGNATSSVANVAVGDKVLVQGTISGTSVAATSVIDSSATTTNNGSDGHKGFMLGVFGSVKGFFHNFFGFF